MSPASPGVNTHAPSARWLAGLLVAILLANTVPAGAAATSARSVSGQFVIRAQPDPIFPFDIATNVALVQLDAMLLSVTAERIKSALSSQLGDLGPWQGKVIVDVFPVTTEADQTTITSERFTDRWQYRVQLPSAIPRPRLVRTIVQVLLIEYANRHPGPHPAEVPFWLVEGLTWRLLELQEKELIIPIPNDMRASIPIHLVQRQARREPPLDAARKLFAQEAPLSFEQLSWPGLRAQEGVPDEVYSRSAQVLVSRLLQRQNGSLRTRQMLELLPQHANWQFAFLSAFEFDRPLEAEKWWALQVAHFTTRNPDDSWDLATSLRKLESTLVTPVRIHSGATNLPEDQDLPLPVVLRTWDPEPTRELLDVKVRDLALLRLRIARELLPLTESYVTTLEGIREKLPRKKKPKFTESAAQLVENLDRIRASAAPSLPNSPPPTGTESASR